MTLTIIEQREHNRIKMAKQRNKWKSQGLCNRCGKRPPLPDSPVCQNCFDDHHADYLKSKAEGTHTVLKRRSQNLCTICGTPVDPTDTYCGKTRSTCDNCRQKRREKNAKLRNWRFPEILERDNYRCQLCGRTDRLHVHHIDGNGKTNPNDKPQNDDPGNLITLCEFCHHALTQLRKPMVNRDFAIILLSA